LSGIKFIDIFFSDYIFKKHKYPKSSMVVYLEDCRKKYLNAEGNVDWSKVEARWAELKNVKVCLANKFWNADTRAKAQTLPQ
jgi:hypothetical protein